MSLVPGTFPSGQTFPGTPQGLLNLFAQYLSAPPSQRSVFIQATSAGIPTDGTAIWYNTGTNTINVYSGGSWNVPTVASGSISAGSISAGSVGTTALADGSVTNAKIAAGTIQYTRLSTGAPTWDTSGNLITAGSGGISTSGTIATSSNASIAGNVTAGGNIAAGGNITAPGTLTVTGNITTSGVLSATGGIAGNITVPPGAVMSFAMSTAPAGWLVCNGVTVPNGTGTVQGVTADFSTLYALLSTTYGAAGTLPDFRGAFLRGWDAAGGGTARGLDPSRTFGSYQADVFKSHTHDAPQGYNYVGSGNIGSGLYTGGTAGTSFGLSVATTSAVTGSTETRPKNYAVLYCIKY